MFLILGHKECKYCTQAKTLLAERNIEYKYIDLGVLYGDGWRRIFTDLACTQKTIPIIFKGREGATEPVLQSLESLHEAGWDLIGTFFDLEDSLNSKSTFAKSDNY